MSDIQWRYSAKSPKIWLIDARASAILVGACLHLTEMTIALTVIIIATLFYIERYKRITPEAALRLIAMNFVNILIGNKRSPMGLRRKRYFSDQRVDI